jgi:hypothetical protein
VKRKPRLTPEQCRWLAEVHSNVVRYNRRGPSLVEAFSDVHDGGLYESEVAPLVKQRLLRWMPFSEVPWELRESDPGPGRRLIGHFRTVDLTDRAIRIFWPDRAAA